MKPGSSGRRDHERDSSEEIVSGALDAVERGLAAGNLGDPRPALAFLAGRRVRFDEAELRGARRRAMLLLATGGDPRLGLELDARAVTGLADDLARPDRREALARGVGQLQDACAERPLLAGAVAELAGEPDLAWRALASALLAEELSG